MQVTYRIPSKKVPYGYIELTGDHTEFPVDPSSPTELAEAYAWYIKTYQAAEVAAFEAAPKAAPKQEDKSIEDAIKILDEGLGGVEEVDENAPAKPWDKTSDTATEEKKPWVTDDSDWDFS